MRYLTMLMICFAAVGFSQEAPETTQPEITVTDEPSNDNEDVAVQIESRLYHDDGSSGCGCGKGKPK